MAIERNITADDDWFKGEDKQLVYTIYQSDGTTAQDVTGWSLSWRLKRRKTDADAATLLTKTTSSGIALTTPASGIVTVSIADTDTDGISAGIAYHELKRTDAGAETVLTFGSAYLRDGVHDS